MDDDKERRDEPVPSLESIEIELEDKHTVMVTGYDGDGNFWKEFYRHDESVLADENNEEENEE